MPNVVDCVCGGKARIHRGEVGFYVRCEFDPGFASATEYCTAKRAANAWNKAQLEMEQLTRDAVCAYHRRKSYGQYIAGIPVELPAKREDKSESVAEDVPRCQECGKPMPPNTTRIKYCSAVCADIVMDRQRSASIKRRKLNKNDS